MSIKKCFPLFKNAGLLVCSDHKPLLKIFTDHTDNKKCNTWGLEAVAIPKHVKVQHFKGIDSVIADSVSRLRVVGLHHNLDSKDHQQEFKLPFEPLPPVEQATHMPIQVNEIFIAPDIEKLTTNYDALHDLPTVQRQCTSVSRECFIHRYPSFRTKFNVLTRTHLKKVVKLQKNNTFYKKILEHIHCCENANYFTDAMGILQKKVINFNSTFAAVVIPQILITYLLHASHNSLCHI